MARALQFVLDDTTVPFEIGAKVDKRALYGHARRIAEKDGVELSRGLLLPSGRLLPGSALSFVRVDPLGSPVEELQTLIDGQVVEPRPSAFDEPNLLQPVQLALLARFQTQDVYPLLGGTLAPGLYQLSEGFSYRKSPQRRDALLLVREDQAFLLVGLLKASSFLDLAVSYEFFDAEAEQDEDDELDFSMI